MHWAARNGRLEVCRYLHSKGADPHALTCDGDSPFMLAAWQVGQSIGSAPLGRSDSGLPLLLPLIALRAISKSVGGWSTRCTLILIASTGGVATPSSRRRAWTARTARWKSYAICTAALALPATSSTPAGTLLCTRLVRKRRMPQTITSHEAHHQSQ